MEEFVTTLVGHAKNVMSAVVNGLRGLPLVGPYVDFAAYGFAAYALGHFYLGWW